MNIFSIVIFTLILYELSRKKTIIEKYIDIFIYSIIIELFVNIGYFAKIGNYELEYAEFMLIILVAISIYILFKKGVYKKSFKYAIILTVVLIINTIKLIMFPSNCKVVPFGMDFGQAYAENKLVIPEFQNQTILILIRFVIFIIIALALSKIITKNHLRYINESILAYGKYIFIILIIEKITRSLIDKNMYSNIIIYIFGNSSSTLKTTIYRAGNVALQGLNKEPAQLACGLFYFGLILICSNNKKKEIYFLIDIIFLLLTGSFTGIWCAIFLCILNLIEVKKYRIAKIIIIIILCIALGGSQISEEFTRRINNSLFTFTTGKMRLNNSEQGRIFSVIKCFEIFKNNPLIGIGLGTTYCYGYISSILSNMGISGFISWSLFAINLKKNKRLIKSLFAYMVLIIFWCLAGSIATAYSLIIILLSFEF